MTQTTKQLESLISNHCSSMTFQYGEETVLFGDAECRIVLQKTVDAEPAYSGVICTNHRVDDESRNLVFELLLENGDVVAAGPVLGGGRLEFAFSNAVAGRNCQLRIGEPQGLRRALKIPFSLRRGIRPEFTKHGLAADERSVSTDRGAVRVVGPNVIVRIAANDLPFDLLVLAASDQTGSIVRSYLIHLPGSGYGHRDMRTASIDASYVTGSLHPDECCIDAWGLTTSAETQTLVTGDMLDAVAASSPAAEQAVACFRMMKPQ